MILGLDLARDIYVYEDEFSPGRIFLSIKTSLRNQSYFESLADWQKSALAQQRIDQDSVRQKLEIAHHVSADPAQLAYTVLLTLDAERGRRKRPPGAGNQPGLISRQPLFVSQHLTHGEPRSVPRRDKACHHTQ